MQEAKGFHLLTSDPRSRRRLSPRDLAALIFIGEGYEVAQYQLHQAIFRDLAPNVVSRFVQRAKVAHLIAVERLHRVGINRLRLTFRGRDAVAASGYPRPGELFIPRKSVALKDLAHTLWLNDLRLVLREITPPPTDLAAAWTLQRRNEKTCAIPDLLAIWNGGDVKRQLYLACEIDLGGEPLKRVFLPKLDRLSDMLLARSTGAPSAILVLTRGARRAELLRDHASRTALPLLVELLPREGGHPEGLATLRSLVAVR
jgi:hypothetical protein